jgi:hypothetical protein
MRRNHTTEICLDPGRFKRDSNPEETSEESHQKTLSRATLFRRLYELANPNLEPAPTILD